MKVDLALEELYHSENDLAGQVLALSDRHEADHEIFHVARDLAVWSQDHVRWIAAIGHRFGLDLDPEPAGDPTLLQKVRWEVGDRLGRRSAPALLLLRDLRSIYIDASGVPVDWELIAQAAQGIKDQELFDLATSCHPDTLLQAKWADAHLKESAPQILGS